jgi:flavocytochrome c
MMNANKIVALLTAILMCTGLTACAGTASTAPASSEATSGKKTALKAGAYTATTPGMNAEVKVEVTVDEKSIVSAKVTAQQETPGIGSDLCDASGKALSDGGLSPVTLIPQNAVEYQTLNVDMVAGATITSAAVKNALKDCMIQAGANLDEWQDKMPAKAPIADESADVIVVGGGGAGLAAAISAAENGASVIVIEKNGSVGGDTLVCGAIYNNPDEALQSRVTMSESVKSTLEKALAETPVNEAHAALQKEVQAQWDKYKADGRTDLFDSAEWFALQTWINGDKVGNLDLVKTLTYNAEAGYKWITGLDMSFHGEIGQGAGALWQRTHTSTMPMGTGFISTYVQKAAANGKIKILTSTTGKALLQDASGKIIGVTVEDKSGNQATFSASKGVILATGGFSANSKLVQQYNTSGKWEDLSSVPTTNRFSCSQGDGITMATAVGASLTDMEQIQLLYLGNTKDGLLTKYPPRDVSGTSQVIFINKEGERFVKEDGRRDDICKGVLAQTDRMYYILESGSGKDYVDIADPSWRSADGFTFDYLKDNGYILVGDTLEELAAQIGCDPAALQKTIDTFNASVESGKDEFGRTLYECKLEKGPWVATARQACIHHTMGGVTIDTQGHVLDKDGKVIEGLVACGELTGGIHGANRLGGNAVVDTVVFGKLAGETITKG